MPKRATYESVAAALGEAPSTIRHWTLHESFPFRGGDLDAMRRWRDAHRARNAKGVGGSELDAESARIQLATAAVNLKERAAKAGLVELRLARQRQELIEVAVVEAEFAALGEKVKRQFLALPRQIAAELEGQSAAAIESILRAEISKRLQFLQRRSASDS